MFFLVVTTLLAFFGSVIAEDTSAASPCAVSGLILHNRHFLAVKFLILHFANMPTAVGYVCQQRFLQWRWHWLRTR